MMLLNEISFRTLVTECLPLSLFYCKHFIKFSKIPLRRSEPLAFTAGPAPRGGVFLNPLPDYDSDSVNSEFMTASTHTTSSTSSTSRLSQQEVLSLISGNLRLSIEPLLIPHYYVQLHDIVGKGE